MNRFFLLLLLFPLASSFAREWQSADFGLAIIWQNNAAIDSSPEGQYPSDVLFSPGASLISDLDGQPGGLYFSPSGWLSWNIEDVYEGVARPADEADAGHMKVLGITADAHWGYQFRAAGLKTSIQAGPSALLKIPLLKAQNGNAGPGDFWKAYYGSMQMLALSMAAQVSVPFADSGSFVPGFRLLWPVSNLWSPAPLSHGLQAALTVSVRFPLPE